METIYSLDFNDDILLISEVQTSYDCGDSPRDIGTHSESLYLISDCGACACDCR